MKEEAFIQKNENHWKTLEEYNRKLLRGGLRALPTDEVRVFADLFRLAGYHLAYAKTHYPDGSSLPYLNRIVGVAHNFFYVRETSGLTEVRYYLTRGFPLAVREARKYLLAAAMLFLLGAVFAGLYVSLDPGRFYQIFPSDYLSGDGSSGNWDYPLMSAAIMTNNIRVAFSAFALGVFAGVGTVYVLVYNGIILGGLAGYLMRTGSDMILFWSLILPHGVWELAAIFLSGACGLMIGRALLIPGSYTRKDALVMNAKKAAGLIPGIVIMLIAAGLVEGFFTPLEIPPAFKLVFAGLTLFALLAYVLRVKR